jgi:hypothetical protein
MEKLDMVMIGDRVRYESAAGTIRGEVKSIYLAKNLANQLIPWLTIEYVSRWGGHLSTATFAGSEENLEMMKFQVNFRDKKVA